MKNKLFISTLILSILVGGFSMIGYCQQEEKPAEPADLAKLRAAIQANPNDLSAHEAYLKASGFTKWGAAEDPEFIKQYQQWMQQFPQSATVAYALGHAYAGKESPKAKPYLLKAIEIDPKFDKAYFDLWIDAERWGDFNLSREYIAMAKKTAPKNADYAFYYANTFSDGNPAKYTKESLKVAKKFPNTERGAQALYWLANRTKDEKKKVKYYEMQKKQFPADKFSWTSSGMSEYYNLLLRTSTPKAITLAEEMAALKNNEERDKKMWQTNITTAKNIQEVEELLAQQKPAEALALMDKVTVPRYSSAKDFILFLKTRSMESAGKVEDAYKTLLLSYVKEPTKKVYEQLVTTAGKLGKNEAGVNSAIWYVRDTSAKQAPVFNLHNYYTNSLTSLNDYNGKVVLITYWFPGCGPCRGEFPHFENVVRNFRNNPNFVYLGINIVPEQDDYVLPFMKASGYSFIPLKDNDKWTKGPLDNRNAAPVNFLIDGSGKIIFANFRTDGTNEETLQMMISSMLDRNKSA